MSKFAGLVQFCLIFLPLAKYSVTDCSSLAIFVIYFQEPFLGNCDSGFLEKGFMYDKFPHLESELRGNQTLAINRYRITVIQM